MSLSEEIKNRVDKILCITCPQAMNTGRWDSFKEEISRLGLSDIMIPIINVESSIEREGLSCRRIANRGAWRVRNSSLGHYHAIKFAKDCGLSSVMIVEDDFCIPDMDRATEYIKELPENSNSVWDYNGLNNNIYSRIFSSGSKWGKLEPNSRFNMASCNIYNHNGIRILVDFWEKTGIDKKYPVFDAGDRIYEYLTSKTEVYIPKECVSSTNAIKSINGTGLGEITHNADDNEIDIYKSCSDIFPVVYCSDGNDFDRLGLSARSVKKFMGDNVRTILITDSKNSRPNGIDEIYDPRNILSDVGMFCEGWNRQWPFATLFRLILPIVDSMKKYNRALYLDSDVLCRTSEANVLKTMDISGYEIFGAFDHESKYKRIIDLTKGDDIVEDAKSLIRNRVWDIVGTEISTYVNAGVILWNLEEIRNNGLDWYKQRLRWFWEGETRGKFAMLDQDFINIMLKCNGMLNKRMNWFGQSISDDCIFQHFVTHSGKKRIWEVASRIGIA